jgi:hypothetical protein
VTLKNKSKYPKWRIRHETVLRWIWENPSLSQKACAQALGYSVSHISRISNSPEFKIRFRELCNIELSKIMDKQALNKI